MLYALGPMRFIRWGQYIKFIPKIQRQSGHPPMHGTLSGDKPVEASAGDPPRPPRAKAHAYPPARSRALRDKGRFVDQEGAGGNGS
jgi:hypothetical protein